MTLTGDDSQLRHFWAKIRRKSKLQPIIYLFQKAQKNLKFKKLS